LERSISEGVPLRTKEEQFLGTFQVKFGCKLQDKSGCRLDIVNSMESFTKTIKVI